MLFSKGELELIQKLIQFRASNLEMMLENHKLHRNFKITERIMNKLIKLDELAEKVRKEIY
jgi:hypothetical protein